MLKRIAERIVRSVDCGVTAFVNELYQFKVLAPLQEPELADNELVALRQLIEDRWPRIEDREQLQDEVITKWSDPDFDVAGALAEAHEQARGYAARTRTPFDSADEEARTGTCGAAAENSGPAPVDAPDAGAGPLNGTELYAAAAAIRAWLNDVDPRLVANPDFYRALADRLTVTAALALTPVSN